MKISKWMSMVAVVGLSTSLALAAPSGGERGKGRHGRGHHDGARLAGKLNLSVEQKQKWETMRKVFREENDSFLESFHQTRKEFHEARKAGDTARADSLEPTLRAQREQMKQLRQAQSEKFASMLNPDQRAQFDQMKAERQERRGKRGEQGGKG